MAKHRFRFRALRELADWLDHKAKAYLDVLVVAYIAQIVGKRSGGVSGILCETVWSDVLSISVRSLRPYQSSTHSAVSPPEGR